MATTIVSPPMRRKADALAELLPTLSRGRSKVDGRPFYVVPASNRISAHWTALDGSGCTCLGFQRRGTCTHGIAARTVHERQQSPAPQPRPSYSDLFPACRDCGDLADGLDNRCSRCASDREWQARRDAASR